MSKKRRNFTAQFKFETVLEGLQGEKAVAEICRERDITDSLYYKWRDTFFERASDIFADQRGPQRDEQADRMAELERLAGKQALEIEILKKGWQLAGVDASAKRQMIEQMKADYPVRQLCATLDCPASTAYYVPRRVNESAVVAAIEQVLLRFPFYGYRKVHQQLLRGGVEVGEHVVRRLLRELGATRSVGKVRVQTTDSKHPHPRYPNRIKGLRLKQPDQVWVADITYIRLGRRFIYLAVILDAYTRAVRGWALSRSIDQQLTLDALDMALTHGTPSIFHSDQGSQYAAWLHTDRLLALQVNISMSDKASPTQNGLVERFMRTVKEEHVDYSEYNDFEDAYRQLQHWLEVVYMTERIHQALDYLTPVEFELAVRAEARYPLLSPA